MSYDTTPAAAGEQLAARAIPAVSPAYAWYVVCALSLTNMVSYVERFIPTLLRKNWLQQALRG